MKRLTEVFAKLIIILAKVAGPLETLI